MATRFYPNQVDYITQLNLMEDKFAPVNDVASGATHYPVFATASLGSLKIASTKITFIPSTGILSVTGLTLTGTPLAITSGGTGSSTAATAWGMPYASSTTTLAYTAAGTAGQVMRSNGNAAPSWVTLDMTFLPDAFVKKSVRVASTGNLTLSGLQTVDSVLLVANDRVLVKNQTTASQNGIYAAASGAWTRTAGANSSAELAGAIVAVDSGSQGGKRFVTTFKTTDTLGTTAMSWFENTDSGNLRSDAKTVATLPTANATNQGLRLHVTDSTVAASGNFGATVAGGGTNVVPVFCTGTAWIIA